MPEENCSIIPSEQLRNKESEYYKKLEAARTELKTEEKLKIHRMLFGLMDSVGGVREDVFEFFLNHNFECAAQVMRCKDLFSRLAEAGWFGLMFEEKSVKDTNAFPHWQEAILRGYRADIPFEQMKKMYVLSFVPIDLNRMVNVYTNKLQLRIKELEEKLKLQEENTAGESETEVPIGVWKKEWDKLLGDFQEEKMRILSEFEEEKEIILQKMQEVVISMQALQKKMQACYETYWKEEVSMRQDVAKLEETSIRQDVTKSEEVTVRQDVVKPEEVIVRQDVVKPETAETIDTGIQTLDIAREREKQIKRLNVFTLAYKKIKRKNFLASGENEKKSGLFNMLAKGKFSKEYMITINLLMKTGMEKVVLYDFIERNTSLEELKNVLEAVTSEGEGAKYISVEVTQEQQEKVLQDNEEAGEIPEDASETFFMEEGEEDYL